MRSIRLVVIALALLVGACASGSGSGERGPRRDPNLITAEDLSQLGQSGTALDAVRRLRTAWLTGRGGRSPAVFVDGLEMGNTRVLENYRLSVIREIRYISAPDATMRWGTGYGSGVIEIITR